MLNTVLLFIIAIGLFAFCFSFTSFVGKLDRRYTEKWNDKKLDITDEK